MAGPTSLPDLKPLRKAQLQATVLQGDPNISYLVLFDGGTPEDRWTEEALAAAEHAHPDRIRAFKAPLRDFLDDFAAMEANRREVDTFNFRRLPIVGLYRRGRLITTFNPRRVYFDPKLQAREVRSQLEIFLRKLVFYDPARVREQTNLEVAGKAEGGEAAGH
jgi:hypothetical protein